MKIKETKKNIIQAGQVAVDELIKVAKEPIVDSEDDISADRLKNAAATKKLAIFDAFEILKRIQEEEDMLNEKPKKEGAKKEGAMCPFFACSYAPRLLCSFFAPSLLLLWSFFRPSFVLLCPLGKGGYPGSILDPFWVHSCSKHRSIGA